MSKKAIVIGIDAYPGASRLNGCVNDAREMTGLLERNGDGTKNFDVALQTDVSTIDGIRKLIWQAFAGDSEVALLYFSGHGYLNELGGYIVTPDAKAFDEGVPMDTILQVANASKCRNRVIILDCCFAGATGEPRYAAGTSTQVAEGVTILMACRKDEPSREVNGHGIFTNLLLEALRGGAANLGGAITPGSIYAYIDQALGEFDQRPVFKTNITRFVSLRQSIPPVPEDVLRRLTDYFPSPGYQYSLDPSYEDTNSPDWKSLLARPYAKPENVARFKDLQALQSVGLVIPVGAPFMYFAAMDNKSCRLTPLGQHYWRLVNDKRI
jgi:caspase domain-containing protein